MTTSSGSDKKTVGTEEDEKFYMLRPVNKTDHMQQSMNVLA